MIAAVSPYMFVITAGSVCIAESTKWVTAARLAVVLPSAWTYTCMQTHANSSMGTLNKNSSYSPVGSWVCRFVFFRLHDLSVCFVLPWTVESFPLMFWHWCNKLKWATFELLFPPYYFEFGARSSPFRAMVNKKQYEMRGYLCCVSHLWIVQDSRDVPISQSITFFNYFTDINLLTKLTFKGTM